MKEIFLLGSFHFRDSNLPFFTAAMQTQLEGLCQKLAAFHPTKIAVEYAEQEQASVDQSYARLALDDFSQFEKMAQGSLGSIRMFGTEGPIDYQRESVQIGYRLGKMLDHGRVYAIDDDSEMDDAFMKQLTPTQSGHFHSRLKALAYPKESNDLSEILTYYNEKDWSYRNHSLYLWINALNTDGAYNGTKAVAQWYERNLKIFSNIQNLCEDGDRLLVIYGVGHLALLRDFIRASDDMTLIEYDGLL